ncbi:MAG: hypothetical protein GXP38_12115 [Chloroflexi bacterium]|nr:hypothetical protein [Chloroflexota bacterium]
MIQETPQIEKPLSVIDCLQHGFSLISRYPWLLALPLLLDLFLWRGPRISVTPYIDHTINVLLSQPDLPPDITQNAELISSNMHMLGESINLTTLLSGMIIGLPSYWGHYGAVVQPKAAEVIAVEKWQQLFFYVILFIPIGLLIASVWLAWIVHALDREMSSLRKTIRRAGWIWLNTGLFTLLLFGSLLALAIFLSLLSVVGMLLGGTTGATLAVWIFLFFFILFGLWIAIGLKFVVAAIALDRVNLARAAWRSFNVVGRNTPATIFFILLSVLLSQGFARIWLAMDGTTLGISVGILGNAYIGASLSAAGLYFYRTRYQYWQKMRSAMFAEPQQEA